MKKTILLIMALIFTLCMSGFAFSATTQTAEIHVMNESDYPSGGDNDYDESGNLKLTLYKETLEDAFDAADGYVDEDSAFADPVIILDKNITLDSVMELEESSYENLSTITVRAGKGNTIVIDSDGERHFIINGFKPQLTFSGVTFAGSAGNNAKGGVQINNGTVNFDSVTFSSNGTDSNGGAIDISNGTVNFTGTNTFTGNLAENGGAVNITGGTVTLAGTFTNNTSNVNGGAVCITGGNITFGAVSFTGNNASQNGGALYADGVTLSLSENVSFSSNNAGTSGGAVYLAGTSSSLIFSGNASFSSNTAGSDGGAIALAAGSLTLSGTTVEFKSNNAGTNGGAASISGGELILSSSGIATFDNNKSPSGNGGAIYVSGAGKITAENSTVHFTNNHASWPEDNNTSVKTDPSASGVSSGFGGALCMTGSATLNFGAVNFNNNKAALGAGVYISSGIINFSGAANFGNSSTTSSFNDAYNGGALYASGGTTNFNSTVSFRMNQARDNGGAIYSTGSGTHINFTETPSFSGNTANSDRGSLGDGGAVWWGSDFNNFPSSGVFDSNKTNGTLDGSSVKDDAGNGGAIYISGEGTLKITRELIFRANEAFNNGGAVYVSEADTEINGIEITETNKALHGSGGFINSSAGSVNVTTSTISNQIADKNGGAISGPTITITSSDFTENTAINSYGGAIFVGQDSSASDKAYLKITNARFVSNSSTANSGGAIGADNAEVNITDAYFKGNAASSLGGAIYLENVCDTSIEQCTFDSNGYDGGRLSTQYGGAIRVHGPMYVTKSYFVNNSATKQGGAIYFEQHGTGNGQLSVTSSMFRNNTATGSEGGAMYLNVDEARIEKSTFDRNRASGSTSSSGGAVYLASRHESTIINSTFAGNSVSGSESSGGALLLFGTSRTVVTSCTFTADNSAGYRGGAIFVASAGTLELGGTIVVGNTAAYGGDICSVGTASSVLKGYNRVGSFYEGESASGSGGTADWSKQANRADTDRSNAEWTKSTFFGADGALNDNIIDGEIPPLIGSSRVYTSDDTQPVRLQTIMLHEDDSLERDNSATNRIPRDEMANFPRDDERGADRWSVNVDLDIGAVRFDGTIPADPSNPIEQHSVSTITMSGIPNTLRSVGQSASLIALIRYTDKTTAYGGSGTGQEPVIWESDRPAYVSIDSRGVIRALRPTDTPVKITVSTVRNAVVWDSSTGTYVTSGPASDTQYISMVGEYTELNMLPGFMNYLIDRNEYLAEYDLGLMPADSSASLVKASGFQNGFKSAWNATPSQVTDVTSSSPEIDAATTYRHTGAKAVKSAAARINFKNRKTGDVFPVVYSWEFTAEELADILGYALSEDTEINASLADEIFSVMGISFEGSNKVIDVIGSSGTSAGDAYRSSSLALTKSDGGRGLHVAMTAYLANVGLGNTNASVYSSAETEYGAKLLGSGTQKLLTVPDGTDDGAIYGSMWIVQRTSSSATPPNNNGGNGNNNNNNNGNNNNNNDSNSSGGGGGGGCNAFNAGILAMSLILVFRKR